MYKYEYTGSGIMTFEVDKKSYTVAYVGHPTLSNTVELPKKVNIAGLKLIEQDTKRKSKLTKQGEE